MGDEFTPDSGLVGDEEQPKPEMLSVSADEWNAIKTKMTAFEQQLSHGYTAPVQQPAVQQGPTTEDQIKAIDEEIDALDDEIEERISNGQSVKALRNKQRKLQAQATKIQIEAESIRPLQEVGLGTMSRLSLKMTKDEMPHLDLVRSTFDEYYNQLTEAQKSDPEILKKIYNLAVGQNYDVVVRKSVEETNRRQSQDNALDVGNQTRMTKKGGGKTVDIPDWREHYSQGAIAALERKGIDMEQEVRLRGYKDWNDYYEAHKDYM